VLRHGAREVAQTTPVKSISKRAFVHYFILVEKISRTVYMIADVDQKCLGGPDAFIYKKRHLPYIVFYQSLVLLIDL